MLLHVCTALYGVCYLLLYSNPLLDIPPYMFYHVFILILCNCPTLVYRSYYIIMTQTDVIPKHIITSPVPRQKKIHIYLHLIFTNFHDFNTIRSP